MNYQLVHGSTTVDNSQIIGGVYYNFQLQQAGDLSIGNVPSAELSFVTTYSGFSINDQFTFKVKYSSENSYTQVGVFNVYSVEKNNTGKYEVKAYDNMIKFNVNVDSFIQSEITSSGIALKTLLSDLCTSLGLSLYSQTFTNNNFLAKPFDVNGVTGRNLLSWVAEVAGANIIATTTGQIQVKSFTVVSGAPVYNNTKYKSIKVANYDCPPISKVVSMLSEGDIGISAGSGTNVLNIVGNPLLYVDDESRIQTAVTNIYNNLSTIIPDSPYTYTPADLDLVMTGLGRKLGDIVTIHSSSTGNKQFIVMNKVIDRTGVKINSYGNPTRNTVVQNRNMEYAGLNGKYNSLKTTVDETVLEVGELSGDVTSLSVRVDGIETTVQNVSRTFRQASAPTSGLHSGDLWYCTSSSDTTHYGKWFRYNGSSWQSCADPQVTTNTSSISQQADKIALVVSTSGGTNIVNAASIVAGINDSGSSVQISADKIDLTGYVTLSNLSTSGQSIINGDNITTGTLSADRIQTNSLTADKLKIGNNNTILTVIPGDTTSYPTNAAGVETGTTIGSYQSIKKKRTSEVNLPMSSTYIDADYQENDILNFTINVNNPNASAVSVRLRIYGYDINNNLIVMRTSSGTDYNYLQANNSMSIPANSSATYTSYVKFNAKSVSARKIRALLYWSATNSYNLNVYNYTSSFQRDAGSLIVDGTISASKLEIRPVYASDLSSTGTTVIDGGRISTGTITADKITVSDLRALSATIGGWTIGVDKISSNNGNTYLSSNVSDYAFKTQNTLIGHNGNINTTGTINFTSTSGSIQSFGRDIITPISSNGSVRFGSSTYGFVIESGHLYLLLNGERYDVSINSSGYVKGTLVQ